MEELTALAEKGAPIILQRDWDGSETAILKLLDAGYVELTVDDEDDGKGDKCSCFIKVERPVNLADLREACESGKKEVLISQALVEEGADLLHSFGYTAVEESKILLPSTDNGSVVHFRRLESRSEAVPHELVAVEHVRGEDRGSGTDGWTDGSGTDGWRNLRPVQEDSSKLQDQRMFKLEAEAELKVKPQMLSVQMNLQPSLKQDEGKLMLRMEVLTLSVGVRKKEFENGRQCLGFFPDRIELSLKPQWPGKEALVPVFAASTTVGPSFKRARGTEVSGSFELYGVGITVKNSESREAQVYAHCIDCSCEGGGTAAYVWKLQRWESGGKYERKSPFPFGLRRSIPKLPFRGTTPLLRRDDFPHVTWSFPRNTSVADIKFDVELVVSMQLVSLESVGMIFRSPNSSPQGPRTFHYHFDLKSDPIS